MRQKTGTAHAVIIATAIAGLTLTGATQTAATPDTSPNQQKAATTAAENTRPGTTVHAERYVYRFTAPTRMRTGPSTKRTVVGMAYPGQRGISNHDIYTAHGEYVTCRDGWPMNFWYKVRNSATGVVGWVSRCYVQLV